MPNLRSQMNLGIHVKYLEEVLFRETFFPSSDFGEYMAFHWWPINAWVYTNGINTLYNGVSITTDIAKNYRIMEVLRHYQLSRDKYHWKRRKTSCIPNLPITQNAVSINAIGGRKLVAPNAFRPLYTYWNSCLSICFNRPYPQLLPKELEARPMGEGLSSQRTWSKAYGWGPNTVWLWALFTSVQYKT